MRTEAGPTRGGHGAHIVLLLQLVRQRRGHDLPPLAATQKRRSASSRGLPFCLGGALQSPAAHAPRGVCPAPPPPVRTKPSAPRLLHPRPSPHCPERAAPPSVRAAGSAKERAAAGAAPGRSGEVSLAALPSAGAHGCATATPVSRGDEGIHKRKCFRTRVELHFRGLRKTL